MATLAWQRCGLAAIVGFLATVLAIPSDAAAKGVTITVENMLPADGFYFTPVWVGAHDGSFDRV